MTLEIYIGNSAPVGVGTYLYNTVFLDTDITSKNVLERATAVSGKPIIRWLGESHEISFKLIIEEHQDYVDDETYGLSDLEEIRKFCIGYASGAPAKKCWIRDTEGEYFLRNWKVGIPSGLKIVPATGYPNVVGSALYEVSFNFNVIDDTLDYYTMYRW